MIRAKPARAQPLASYTFLLTHMTVNLSCVICEVHFWDTACFIKPQIAYTGLSPSKYALDTQHINMLECVSIFQGFKP